MKFNLFVNYFKDNNEKRNSELLFCVVENIKNNLFTNVVIISNAIDYDYLKKEIDKLEPVVKESKLFRIKQKHLSEKIVPVFSIERPTYNEYFKLMSDMYPSEDNINIVANLDIIIPEETLQKCVEYMNPMTCLALCRYDIKSNRANYKVNSLFLNSWDSQDTWIFNGAVKQTEYADFTTGIAGCDNKISYLLEQAGYNVINPSITLKTYHYHTSNIRNYGTEDHQRLQPPYKLMTPTE